MAADASVVGGVAPAAVARPQLAGRPVVAPVLGAAAGTGCVGDAEATRPAAGVADGGALPTHSPQDTVTGQEVLLPTQEKGNVRKSCICRHRL